MPQQNNSTTKYVIAIVIILIMIGVGVYILVGRGTSSTGTGKDQTAPPVFVPLNRNKTTGANKATGANTASTTTNGNNFQTAIPVLRLLSNDPVGGYGASTTASTTIVRWVNRGRGNVYETKADSLDITTISNTVVPRIYDSIWNKTLTSFVGSTLSSGSANATTIFASLTSRVVPKPAGTATTSKPVTTTTTATTSKTTTATTTAPTTLTLETSSVVGAVQTPYELKGKNLPSNIVTYALSPKSDRIFMVTNESGHGIGYVATVDGKTLTQIFDTPLTQIVAEWPEDNTIAITTKASSAEIGYMYFVSPKTGVWSKVLGPTMGLTTKVSHDAKYVLASTGGPDSVSTKIYTVSTGKSIDAIIRTIADKCVWGNFNKSMFYCAVPNQATSAAYPDDWYKGIISFADKIWQVNASTGEVHLVTSIVDLSDRVIDAFNLGLDTKDEYLYFMNKNDLSLWSFDLVNSKVQ